MVLEEIMGKTCLELFVRTKLFPWSPLRRTSRECQIDASESSQFIWSKEKDFSIFSINLIWDRLASLCLFAENFPYQGQASHHLITFIKNYFSIGQNFRISYQTNSLRTFCGISTAPHKIGLFLLPYPGQFISLNLQLLFCM